MKSFCKILIIFLLVVVRCNAQTNDSIVSDTIMTIAKKKALAYKLNQDLTAKDNVNKLHFDTIDNRKTKSKENKIFIPDPNKSMWYALIFPGMGQIYNRRYWKLPIVYGGFVGLAYGINISTKNYNLYKHAYKYYQNNDNSWKNLFPKSQQNLDISTIKTRMDGFRRNRDLCIIGTVAFYGITVLDAFVDAALSDFDISPNLSMKINPTIIQNQESMTLAMQMNLKF